LSLEIVLGITLETLCLCALRCNSGHLRLCRRMFRSRRGRGLDNIHRRRRRVSFRRSHWSPLVLEALPAQYRTALRRLERNSGRNATFRALRPRLGPRYARRRGSARRTRSLSASPALARLAALGIVLELLIQKEKLFTGSEDEFTAAICTG
jgi:hypothetical protein